MKAQPVKAQNPIVLKTNHSIWAQILNKKYLILMSFPFVIWVFVFSYIPIWGWTMAFQNYKPGLPFSQQEWVGLLNFKQLFLDHDFYLVMRNTLAMSIMGLVVGFICPIVLAVLLHELKNQVFKRTVQTISYLPHFVSWVVVSGIVIQLLSPEDGIVNQILVNLHIIDKPIQFMAKENWFWQIVTAADVWKEIGWNTIIYLAAIAGIDPQLYEAAKVDGASRFRQIWHITIPGIRTTITILLILSIGNLINIGFEKQMLLGNPLVQSHSNVIQLYALNYGISLGRFSYGTAVGIFNSVVSIILLFTSNAIFKKTTGESVM
ncbi:ABC transporter permease subunit [Neobacillus drentensis]|uniref:ABC transporter permease n=1 Tax=Neobacillus drentensis TaxID=220684 RepID=UPI001F1FABB5|nr:ABC transporter permease subunit [Neobacillus drentensis]ULT57627.1 ABC transporter permease subunit [Neobacillus drentensis]